LQFYKLSYSEIFWVYTIAAIANIILELPTGIFADLIGRKTTMILSRVFTLIAFIIFGFSGNFWMFVLAQLFITLGESFKSGTDVAYIYDYLKQKSKLTYTEVKGKQKFWARVGESIAAAIGGFIAAKAVYSLFGLSISGYNMVFFVAAFPAFLHLLLIFTYDKIDEKRHSGELLKESVLHIKASLLDVKHNPEMIKLIINITIFITVVAGAAKFLQPYMQDARIPIEWFGIIYSVFLIITAVAVRYSYIFERWYSKPKLINVITLIAIIPLLIVGFKFVSLIGVFFFFVLVMGDNIRSPIHTDQFHSYVSSERRATLGSILELFKNVGKAIMLPLFGYMADSIGFYNVMLIMAAIMFFNWVFFRISDKTEYVDV
jgi:MFS family permease